MLLLSMKKATDRFLGDTIRCCHGAKRFLLLHHTMQQRRPLGSGKTIRRLLWPWPPLFEHHRRRASLSSFLRSQQTLHLVIQASCRGKEEGKNWRQRTGNPSVPSDSFQLAPQQVSCVENGFDLSITDFPLACLSPDASRLCSLIADATSSVPHASQAGG